jgi:hypothetical protein
VLYPRRQNSSEVLFIHILVGQLVVVVAAAVLGVIMIIIIYKG